MTAILTEPPRLGELVGDLGPALDQAGAAAPRASPTGLAWRAISGEVRSGLGRDLDEGLVDRLAEGWSKAEALAGHAADRLGQDDIDVTLAAHEFDLTLDPGFNLTIDGVDAGKLPIAVILTVSLRGGVLTLRGGAITEVALGRISLSGHIECAGQQTLLEVATPEFTLPGRHRLKHPVRIVGG